MPWAHLDIAGTDGRRQPTTAGCSKGATGFGTRLLIELATT